MAGCSGPGSGMCLPTGGGGGDYEPHPPRIWENPGTQNCPTPTRGGGCWTANHPPNHPATHSAKSKKRQNFPSGAFGADPITPKMAHPYEGRGGGWTPTHPEFPTPPPPSRRPNTKDIPDQGPLTDKPRSLAPVRLSRTAAYMRSVAALSSRGASPVACIACSSASPTEFCSASSPDCSAALPLTLACAAVAMREANKSLTRPGRSARGTRRAETTAGPNLLMASTAVVWSAAGDVLARSCGGRGRAEGVERAGCCRMEGGSQRPGPNGWGKATLADTKRWAGGWGHAEAVVAELAVTTKGGRVALPPFQAQLCHSIGVACLWGERGPVPTTFLYITPLHHHFGLRGSHLRPKTQPPFGLRRRPQCGSRPRSPQYRGGWGGGGAITAQYAGWYRGGAGRGGQGTPEDPPHL